MTPSYAIQTQALVKAYHTADGMQVQALCGIDLNIRQGEVYALLGPNGAGKTTTIGILTTLLEPSGGRATVAGCDVVQHPAQVRRAIGVTFQEVILDQDLTGRQILDFHGRLYGQSTSVRRNRIAELAELVELEDVLDRRAGTYSGGMKRRLELARGLMTRPSLLFLDEPTQGLDPHNRAGIWGYIRRLRAQGGVTILLTTHYMEEAEALADRVGIMDRGRLIVEGTPQELVSSLGADLITLEGYGRADTLAAALQDEPYVVHVQHAPAPSDEAHHNLFSVGDPGASSAAESAGVDGADPPLVETAQIQVGVDSGARRLVSVLQVAAQHDFHIQSATVNRPSLGEVFLAHTGQALRDE